MSKLPSSNNIIRLCETSISSYYIIFEIFYTLRLNLLTVLFVNLSEQIHNDSEYLSIRLDTYFNQILWEHFNSSLLVLWKRKFPSNIYTMKSFVK